MRRTTAVSTGTICAASPDRPDHGASSDPLRSRAQHVAFRDRRSVQRQAGTTRNMPIKEYYLCPNGSPLPLGQATWHNLV